MESWEVFRPVPFTDLDYEAATDAETFQKIWMSYREPLGMRGAAAPDEQTATWDDWRIYAPAPFLSQEVEDPEDATLFQRLWTFRMKSYSARTVPTLAQVELEMQKGTWQRE